MTQEIGRFQRFKHLLAEIAADPALAFMLALGFSAGLPFLLVFSTLSAWLREAGITHTEIGFLSYVALAYSFKFAWAPIVDRRDVPFLSRFGRRRAWMLLAQGGIALGLIGISVGNPSHSLLWTVGCAFFVAFSSATQDIVIDAWRIGAAPAERQGMMSASYQLGYRIAMLCAGAGCLYIADYAGWQAAYTSMAALWPWASCEPVRAASAGGRAQDRTRIILKTYAEPIAELVRRNGAMLVPILMLVAIYRLPDFVSGVMANPLYIDLGFSKTAIATVSKLYGIWIGIAGVFAGGIAVLRLGLMPTLLIGVVAASSSHLSLALLSISGAKLEYLTLAISVEAFAAGFAGTALIAFMSSLTSPAFAATQYALLSSLYALPGKLVARALWRLGGPFRLSAVLRVHLGIGIPGVLLCLFVWRTTLGGQEEPEPVPELAE